MAKSNPLGKISFERPTVDPVTEEKLDGVFDVDEKIAAKADNDGQPVRAASAKTRSKSHFQSVQTGEGSLDINQILAASMEEDGWVTRNFRLRRSHMNKIKSLTAKANSLGKRSTQDDIISQIFDDWFASKNL